MLFEFDPPDNANIIDTIIVLTTDDRRRDDDVELFIVFIFFKSLLLVIVLPICATSASSSIATFICLSWYSDDYGELYDGFSVYVWIMNGCWMADCKIDRRLLYR